MTGSAESFAAWEDRIRGIERADPDADTTAALLRIAESVLEAWFEARGETPTESKREGFRLLALHRQGAKGDPSFNACRETCRELIYRHNVAALDARATAAAESARMAARLALHLCLFVPFRRRQDVGCGAG
jgi:hypothetical protein